MLRKMLFLLLFIVFCAIGPSPAVAAGDGVTILCYHDIGKVNDDFTISKETLTAHFAYLRQNGYHPISLNQYIDANANKAPLPDKPVLITFDDGYVSFYNDVFPLLKEYQYPAVLAVVTCWETAQRPAGVGQLVNWQQMREMEQTGLVVIASHSHNLHRSIAVNGFGDKGEMAASLAYRDGSYESQESYTARISRDMEENQKVFERELGHRVETFVWPYGEYTLLAVDIAKSYGFKVFLGLGGRANPVGGEQSLTEARRGLIYKEPGVAKFAQLVNNGGNDDPPLKAAWVNIDQIYDATNPRLTDANVRMLLDRYQRLNINTVFMQAYSEAQGDGNIDSVYFYTSVAPVKAPVFDHIARKFRAEGIYVYAVMPTLSGQWLRSEGLNEVVAENAGGKAVVRRATPFSEAVRKSLRSMYSDLAACSFLDGVVFQNDLYLSSNEDFSAAAKQAFGKKTGQPLTAEALKNPQVSAEWVNFKTDTLTELTRELMGVVRQFKPYAKFVRAIHPEVILEKDAGERFAQSLPQFLATYDYVLAVPGSLQDGQGIRSVGWTGNFAASAINQSGGADKLIFQIQTLDREKKRWLLDSELRDYIKVLRDKKVTLFGFYPDAVFNEKSGFLNW